MNGPWHYSEAERLLAQVASLDDTVLLGRAQAHATLAAAAATAQSQLFDDEDTTEWLRAFGELAEQRACRKCGCTQDRACIGGCSWVDDPEGGRLCSSCAEQAKTPDQMAREIVGLG